MAKKSWTHRPDGLPTRQCEGCGRFYHARYKTCPNCETANPTAGSKRRTVKKRVVRSRKTRPVPSRSGGDVSDAALAFIDRAGGLQQAKAALSAIERIRQS